MRITSTLRENVKMSMYIYIYIYIYIRASTAVSLVNRFSRRHVEYYIRYCDHVKYKPKMFPVETKNTQKNENRRLGFITPLHKQHCSLRDCHYDNTPIQIY